jgi:hypothetical protein
VEKIERTFSDLDELIFPVDPRANDLAHTDDVIGQGAGSRAGSDKTG